MNPNHDIARTGAAPGWAVGVVLSVVLIGVPILIATAVWVIIRSVLSLVKAQKREPMPNPETLGV